MTRKYPNESPRGLKLKSVVCFCSAVESILVLFFVVMMLFAGQWHKTSIFHESRSSVKVICALARENLTLLHANNKGTNQTAYLRSQISLFVI